MGIELPPGLLRALRWSMLLLLVVAIALGFSNVLLSTWEDLQAEPITMSWQFVAAWIVFGFAVMLSGALWGQILSDLERRPVPVPPAVAAHCVAWLLKYIPGQVGALVYKIAWAKKRGFSGANAGLSFLYENLFLQIASLVPGMIILAIFADDLVQGSLSLLVTIIGAIGSLLLALILLGPALRWGMVRLAKRVDTTTLRPLSRALVMKHLVLFVFPRVLNAFGFVLIVSAIEPIAPGTWLPLGAIYVVAGAVGILAVFVPSGLGVREGVIVLLASSIIGISSAILASIIARFIATAADLIIAGLAFSSNSFPSRSFGKDIA